MPPARRKTAPPLPVDPLVTGKRAASAIGTRAMFDQIQRAKSVVEAKERLNEAYEREQQSITDTVERLNGLATSWKAFRDDLVMGDQSILTGA